MSQLPLGNCGGDPPTACFCRSIGSICPPPPGASQLSFKSPAAADAATSSLVLQLWRERRLVSELLVPKAVHGALVNDGYFASGAAWSTSEDLVAYTAEVCGGRGRATCPSQRLMLGKGVAWPGISLPILPRCSWDGIRCCCVLSRPHHRSPPTPTSCPHLSHLQGPPSEKTPAWCGPESLKDRAGPKSWRGVGAALEDWGELNTGECV